ncbi:MAPEG family protein [Vibrio rarus]|uniref:MAPEG family protein n=1 Tax=Vibrio rarus TaxID=413403 RepID=UPI0021C3BC02|nr:MAPEG family protein [Vibrio rarus]
MITSLYAAILAGWICYLSVQVIKQRRKHQVSHSDGQVDDLAVARGAHSNATEYIPIGLILLLLAELNGLPLWALHLLGAVFVVGRFAHGYAVLNKNMKARIFSMLTTFGVIGVLMVINIWQVWM